jgi:hypothetical protein
MTSMDQYAWGCVRGACMDVRCGARACVCVTERFGVRKRNMANICKGLILFHALVITCSSLMSGS